MERKKLAIKGMHCRSCEALITDSLMEMDGVQKVKIDHNTGSGEVEYDNRKTDVRKIIRTVEEQGYGCKEVGQ